ncbi:MAG: ester cyclase [Gemmatimonadaceae bacterium]
MVTLPNDLILARTRMVEEHLRRENAHDLPGIMATFGANARYDDEPWGEHHEGRDAVQGYYASLLAALPDLRIDVKRRLATEDAVALEVIITGTHLGAWRGLPATGRRVEIPLSGFYAFDEDGRLASERIYYDRSSLMQQLGLYRDPQSMLGRLEILLGHPLTLVRAYMRKLLGR